MEIDEQNAAWESFKTREEVITFAQYMLSKNVNLLGQQQELLNEAHALVKRAAELLRENRDEENIGIFQNEREENAWRARRDQWLKDAGL